MSTSSATLSLLAWVVASPGLEPQPGREIWNRIESFAAQTPSRHDPGLDGYLKSLTPEETLAAARLGCEAADSVPGVSDDRRLVGAAKAALLCMQFYMDDHDPDARGRELLSVIANSEEHAGIRVALISSMTGPSRRYAIAARFHEYALTQFDAAEPILVDILTTQRQKTPLRTQVITSLASLYRKLLERVVEVDPNVTRVRELTPADVAKPTFALEVVTSGQAVLTEPSVLALQPIESRILENVKLLGRIIADDSEPEPLREAARHALEGYRRFPLVHLDQVDAALGNAPRTVPSRVPKKPE